MQNLRLQWKLTAAIMIPAGLLLLIAIVGLFLGRESGIATLLGLMGLLGAVACAAVGYLIVAPVLEAFQTVLQASTDLSERRLPAMLNGEESTFGFEQLVIAPTGDPDVDILATSLEKIHAHSASSFYEQQGRVREGLSQVVANLARRNQSLLDRQITLIDEMEETEENPKRLDRLFRLDHMATHMKRNQESLLVLAGAESRRRRTGEEEVEDVVQVAMGEVEEYRRINVRRMEPVSVSGAIASDLAHLMSELLENACTFSSPETVVTVTGAVDDSGAYVLSVSDQGVGMSEQQLTLANKLLLEPPDLGLNMGRTLGFAVIGKLAERLEVDITLVSNPSARGVTAIVELPPPSFTLLQDPIFSQASSPALVQAPVHEAAPPVIPERRIVAPPIADPLAKFRQSTDEDNLAKLLGSGPAPTQRSRPAEPLRAAPATPQETWVPPQVTPKGPAKLADAVPTGEKFDDGLKGLLDPAQQSNTGLPSLVRRDPGAATPETAAPNPFGGEAQPPMAPGRAKASGREPDEIRSMLSRYRDGIKSKDVEKDF